MTNGLLRQIRRIRNIVVNRQTYSARLATILENIFRRLPEEIFELGSHSRCSFSGTQSIVINTVNTPVQLNVPMTGCLTDKNFIANGEGKVTYVGEKPINIFSTATVIVQGGVGDRLSFYIAKNEEIRVPSRGVMRSSSGGDFRQAICQDIIPVETGDELTIWGENNSDDSNFTLTLLNFINFKLI